MKSIIQNYNLAIVVKLVPPVSHLTIVLPLHNFTILKLQNRQLYLLI